MCLLFAVLLLILAACGEHIDPPPQPGERHAVAVEWRIVDRATLESEYRRAGMPLRKGDRLHGFAGRLPDGRAVVYTLPPRAVDDDAVCTLGHEIMHITHGDYHR